MLQFQTDVSAAQLARVQGLSDLRQLLGYESIAADYDVAGSFDYPAGKGQSGGLSVKGSAEPAGPARGTAGSDCREQPARAAKGHRQTRRHRASRATRTLVTATTFRCSGRCSCRFSTATRARLRAPVTPSRRRRSRRNSPTGQVLTDVRDAFENLRTNDQVVGLYRSGYLDAGAAVPRHQRVRLPARRRQPARFSRCGAQLPGYATRLPPGAGFVSARARTASRSCRNQELAMMTSPAMRRHYKLQSGVALACVCALTACSSNDRDGRTR